ncbi:MAG: flagellar assembly protein FliX [Alphaproteobacteria bacterium]|nr:flagellar assembly protein FliX [Alphaproteobacteria bacterium]MDE2336155.1 flagellar assembly protein FliX [Alphaproteobacteria bacterium]
MKIEGPNKTSTTKGASKADAKKTGDGTFDTMMGETAEAPPQAATGRPASIGALDMLLTLQAAESGTSEEAAKKARKRANDLLDHLDKIKIGLLTGELQKSELEQLAQTVASHRDQVIDPKLAEILDDIDLRAQVELAKLSY